MAKGVRVILFTANADYAPTLRHHLLGIPGVKIVAEVDDTILLTQVAERFPADIVLMDLDPLPDEVLPVGGALALERQDLHIFALSESTDGQLILAAMRAGIAEFLTKPLDVELLSIAFDRVVSRKTTGDNSGQLITVVGSAGGVGATMLASNLAVELAAMTGPGQVALVDMDYRFGQVATMLDVQPSFTIADLVESTEQLETSMLERAMTKHESGVHILARPHHFAQADMITAATCAGVLTNLQQLYKYVVVDGPSRFDVGGKPIFDLADINLLLIQLLVTSVRNVHRIVESMREVGFNMDRVKIVCNRVGKESGSISIEYVEETLNHKVFISLPDDWTTVCSAINMGIPLNKEHGKSRIRQSIQKMAEMIHQPQHTDKAKELPAKRGGLLSKMFSKGT
ncbi:MAG: hypothetical protein HJJLKODD_00264 [Phycisphaerae bacterium]|nr:hypothetical protein [Phycisphaerae bacterium]